MHLPAPDTAFSSLTRGSDNRPWYPVSWGPAMYSLVDSSYHYILNGDGSEELYDAHWDPAEKNNLVGSPRADSVLPGLRATMAALVPGLPTLRPGKVEHPRAPDGSKGR